MKKIAAKNSVAAAGKTLDPLIDDPVRAGIFTPVKASRLKADAAVRNRTAHAEWDQIDLKDVGAMIGSVRQLLVDFL